MKGKIRYPNLFLFLVFAHEHWHLLFEVSNDVGMDLTEAHSFDQLVDFSDRTVPRQTAQIAHEISFFHLE